MTRARDDEGYLDMSRFSDEEPAGAARAAMFPAPPPLSDSDWSAAVAQAAAAPIDAVAAADVSPGDADTDVDPSGNTGDTDGWSGDGVLPADEWPSDGWSTPNDSATSATSTEAPSGDPFW